jgi:hypothetical protein
MKNVKWPEIFETGIIPENANKMSLCADGLTAWALVGSGNAPHENFGIILEEIGGILDVIATSESLMAYSIFHMPGGIADNKAPKEIYLTQPDSGKDSDDCESWGWSPFKTIIGLAVYSR